MNEQQGINGSQGNARLIIPAVLRNFGIEVRVQTKGKARRAD
jgi:hypothetical protein